MSPYSLAQSVNLRSHAVRFPSGVSMTGQTYSKYGYSRLQIFLASEREREGPGGRGRCRGLSADNFHAKKIARIAGPAAVVAETMIRQPQKRVLDVSSCYQRAAGGAILYIFRCWCKPCGNKQTLDNWAVFAVYCSKSPIRTIPPLPLHRIFT
jgi:hypothetical protein